jgi:hypothetical protein
MSNFGTTDFFFEVVQGNIDGFSYIHKFGNNSDIDTASGYEAIWNGGSAYTGFDATAAEIVELFSDDANDTSAGTGARTVQLDGLDANYVEQSETIILNGTTAVSSSLSYLRCDRMQVLTAGTGGENIGELTLRQSVTTANIFCVMPATSNQTMIACYTVPAGKDAYITSWFCTLINSKTAASIVRIQSRGLGSTFQRKEVISVLGTGTSAIERGYNFAKGPFPEKTDIYISANSDTNNTGVSAGFDMILKET